LRNFSKKFPAREQVLANQAPGEEDMSLGEFISWFVGKEFIDLTVSAVMHGIYAADIYKLSARETLADKTNLFEAYAEGDLTNMVDVFRDGVLEMYPDGPEGTYNPNSLPFFKTLVENDRFGIPSADFKVLAGQILDVDDPNWGNFRPIGVGSMRPGGKYLNDMARRSAFMTLEGGLETLVERVAEMLRMSGVNVLLNSRVSGLVSENGKVGVSIFYSRLYVTN
jgi:protoporphyrinogen oxidase